MKKLSNADLQDRFDKAEYANYYTKDGIKHCKIGLEIWRKEKKNWELIGENGIENPNFNAINFDGYGRVR